MKVKQRYKQVAEMWNRNMTRKQIANELQVSETAVRNYLAEAKRQNISLREKEKAEIPPRSYEIIANLWNAGLNEEEIAQKVGKKVPTVIYNLREARLRGITLIGYENGRIKGDREKKDSAEKLNRRERAEALRRFKVKQTEDTKAYIDNGTNQILESELDFEEKVKEILKLKLPAEAARLLGVSDECVHSIIEGLSDSEKKEIKKEFVKSRRNVNKNVEELIELGKKPSEALTIVSKMIPVEMLTEMADVYFVMGEEKKAIQLLKRLWMFDYVSPEIKAKIKARLQVLETEVESKTKRTNKPEKQENNAINKGSTPKEER